MRRLLVGLLVGTLGLVGCFDSIESPTAMLAPSLVQNQVDVKTITEIGVLPGAGLNQSEASDVNESGQVVGYSFNASNCTSGFVFRNGKLDGLPALGGVRRCSTAAGINKDDKIVGGSTTDGYQGFTATAWEHGVTIDLGLGDQSFASSINDRGDIVGQAVINGRVRAFMLADGLLTDLGSAGWYSSAMAINESRQVVGVTDDAEGFPRAFLWQNGTMTLLGTLGGPYSFARDINEAGEVVGFSALPDQSVHAFLFSNGTMTDLGTFGGNYSDAYAINDFGHVVGFATDAAFNQHAFIRIGTSMTDLGTLSNAAIPNATAKAITNGGYVAGGSSNATSPLIAAVWKLKLKN